MESTEQIVAGNCTIQVMRGDITRIPVDAIVNAANSMLAGGGGVDGAIHAAGGPSLMQELQQYGKCPTGSAVVTGAGKLPAKYVIHAVGPVYRGGHNGEAELLASCYKTSLQLAQQHACESLSFPSISTGIYGYPLQKAAEIALATVAGNLAALSPGVRTIKFVQFNQANYEIYVDLLVRMQNQQTVARTS